MSEPSEFAIGDAVQIIKPAGIGWPVWASWMDKYIGLRGIVRAHSTNPRTSFTIEVAFDDGVTRMGRYVWFRGDCVIPYTQVTPDGDALQRIRG